MARLPSSEWRPWRRDVGLDVQWLAQIVGRAALHRQAVVVAVGIVGDVAGGEVRRLDGVASGGSADGGGAVNAAQAEEEVPAVDLGRRAAVPSALGATSNTSTDAAGRRPDCRRRNAQWGGVGGGGGGGGGGGDGSVEHHRHGHGATKLSWRVRKR